MVLLLGTSTPLDPKWDHENIITGIRGSTVTDTGPGNERRVMNNERERLVSG